MVREKKIWEIKMKCNNGGWMMRKELPENKAKEMKNRNYKAA